VSRRVLIILSVLLVCLGGCANVDTKRTVYNAMQQRQCIKDTGNPNCDPGHMTYDEYKEERDKLKEQN